MKICLICKKQFKSYDKNAKFCSHKCYVKSGILSYKNERNPNWKGRSSWDTYHKYSVKLLGNKCEFCESTKNVQTHHIDMNTKNNPLDCTNWIRLCCSCHLRLHRGKAKRLLNYIAIKIAYTRKIKKE